MISHTLWTRLLTAFAIVASVAVLGGCGSDDDDAPAVASGDAAPAPSDSDAARIRLIQCLREQGIEIPDSIGQGSGPQPQVDADAIEEALDGPCADLRTSAFDDGEASAESAAQDKMDKYAQCMRDAGFDFPDVELGDGPPLALHEIDQTDPDFIAADEECADLRVTPADIMG